jgi:hypothetical protein
MSKIRSQIARASVLLVLVTLNACVEDASVTGPGGGGRVTCDVETCADRQPDIQYHVLTAP